MRLVDARNHRQGDGDQRPRLTASRRCVQDGDRGSADLPPMRDVGGRGHPSARRGRSLFGQIALLHATARCRATPRHAGNLSPFVAGIAGGATDLTYIKPRAGNGGIGHSHFMSAKPQQLGPPNVGAPASTIPLGLRVLGMALRALFIGALVVVTVRVSSPQSETFASVYETPGDLIRLALGFGVCLWIVIHLFMLPKDADGYRTWVYLGLVVAPLALALAIVLW